MVYDNIDSENNGRETNVSDVVSEYEDVKKSIDTENTVDTQLSRIRDFVEWLEDSGYVTLEELKDAPIEEYREYLMETRAEATVPSDLSTVRMLLRYCDAVSDETVSLAPLLPKLMVPKKSAFSEEELAQLRDHLHDVDYASRTHVLVELLTLTGQDLKTLRRLDVGDIDFDDGAIELSLAGRRATGVEELDTLVWPLDADRQKVLERHLSRRHISPDDGDQPLFAASTGRVHTSTLRKSILRLTRPCNYGDSCPGGREMEECIAVQDRQKVSRCPYNATPRDIADLCKRADNNRGEGS